MVSSCRHGSDHVAQCAGVAAEAATLFHTQGPVIVIWMLAMVSAPPQRLEETLPKRSAIRFCTAGLPVVVVDAQRLVSRKARAPPVRSRALAESWPSGFPSTTARVRAGPGPPRRADRTICGNSAEAGGEQHHCRRCAPITLLQPGVVLGRREIHAAVVAAARRSARSHRSGVWRRRPGRSARADELAVVVVAAPRRAPLRGCALPQGAACRAARPGTTGINCAR